jgi:lysophospholipase L1-like esterase
LVPANGAHLVDPYDEFLANSRTYISADGLHLTAEGNRALASAFWNRIVAVIPAKQLGLAGSFPR